MSICGAMSWCRQMMIFCPTDHHTCKLPTSSWLQQCVYEQDAAGSCSVYKHQANEAAVSEGEAADSCLQRCVNEQDAAEDLLPTS